MVMQFFIDESGTGLRDRRSSQFVLAATGIPIEALAHVDEQVNRFKRQLVPFAEPEDYELKIRELRRGERFFRGVPWETRAQAIQRLAMLIGELPCEIIAVKVDKSYLTEYIATDDQLYALAFRKLLDIIEERLESSNQPGMLMVDARSDLHSSVQDRRLLDVFQHWQLKRQRPSRIVGLPWFGFSAFYVGLQIADFSAYMIDFVSNEPDTPYGGQVLRQAFGYVRHKVRLVAVP